MISKRGVETVMGQLFDGQWFENSSVIGGEDCEMGDEMKELQ